MNTRFYPIRFTHQDKRYIVEFVSRFQGIADFKVNGRRFSMPPRFGDTYEKGCLERTAYAAYRRATHNDMFSWAKRNGYKNVGAALKFCHS